MTRRIEGKPTDASPPDEGVLTDDEIRDLEGELVTVTFIHGETPRGRDEMVSADLLRRAIARIKQDQSLRTAPQATPESPTLSHAVPPHHGDALNGQATQEEGLLTSQGRSASAWRPIEKGLPSDGAYIQVWVDLKGMHVNDRSYARYATYGPDGFRDGHCGPLLDNVTHWQPEPSPPTQPGRPCEASNTSPTEATQEAREAALKWMRQLYDVHPDDPHLQSLEKLLTSRDAAIEAGVWKKAIEKIRSRCRELRQLAITADRQEKQDFYNGRAMGLDDMICVFLAQVKESQDGK